jgi:hypothetical protein
MYKDIFLTILDMVEHQGENSIKLEIQHLLNSVYWFSFLWSNIQSYDNISQY